MTEQQRSLTANVKPDLTMFVFTLVTANDLPKFNGEQHVDLSEA